MEKVNVERNDNGIVKRGRTSRLALAVLMVFTILWPGVSWGEMSVLLFDDFDDGNYDGWSVTRPNGDPAEAPDVVSSPEGYSLRGVGSGYSGAGLNVHISRPMSISNMSELKIEMRAKSGSGWPNSATLCLYSGDDVYYVMDYGESNQRAVFCSIVNGVENYYYHSMNANVWHDFAWTRDVDGWWSLSIDGNVVWENFVEDDRLTSFDTITLHLLRNQSEIEWVRISVGGEQPVPPTWWNNDWAYRKQIPITNNVDTALHNYSINISLNTADLMSQGKMQSDCGDIRIIENGEEINYGIRDCNSENTEIYFIASDLIVGDNNDIYIYYGNPDANDGFVENWKDAFYIWYDDFDTDRGWYDAWGRGGYYTVSDGYLTVYFSPYTDVAYCPADGSSFPMDNMPGLKAKTKMMVLNNRLCQGAIVLGGWEFGSGGFPIPNIRAGHNRYEIGYSGLISKTINPNQWYTTEFVYNRLTGDWYGTLNGELVSGNRPALESDDFSTIIVAGCNNNNPRVDYIYLRYFIEPEPSCSLGEEEIYSGVCPHDECADAIAVQANEPYSGATSGATGTDTSSCAYEDTLDVWHSFTPKFNYDYTISLCGSAFDTTLSVFDECGGTELACNDDTAPGICPNKLQSQLTIPLAKGSTYFIRIAGYDGETGDYILTITEPVCTEYPAMDFNDDCKVDFRDFAIFSQSWLECNLDPPSLCWE